MNCVTPASDKGEGNKVIARRYQCRYNDSYADNDPDNFTDNENDNDNDNYNDNCTMPDNERIFSIDKSGTANKQVLTLI